MDMRETAPTSENELRDHGGNINAARRLFPGSPAPWVDLSTGINPRPYPVGAVGPSAWQRLPDPSDHAALEQVARIAYGAGPATEVVAAPGTQALLQWLPRLVSARRVGILGFTYGEHEKCWRAAGVEVSTVSAPGDLGAFDVGVVVNPNNPDGRLLPPDLVATTAASMAAKGGLLIVDEAFMDVFPLRDSLVPRLPLPAALVLRSFGKAYGLAGVRLGFAVASPGPGQLLRAALGPWPVSGPAIEIGRRALEDADWLTGTVVRLHDEAGRLDTLLISAGFQIAGGTPLFRLAAHAQATLWFEHFARAGILTRPFRARPDWLRFGLPGEPTDWQRLAAALRSGQRNIPPAS
jgi:cobalamin biosynthesis protein CobC